MAKMVRFSARHGRELCYDATIPVPNKLYVWNISLKILHKLDAAPRKASSEKETRPSTVAEIVYNMDQQLCKLSLAKLYSIIECEISKCFDDSMDPSWFAGAFEFHLYMLGE